MPTSTFLNLPEDKRQRFVDLALQEFAENDYKNASISRVVARAGIAKGSLYQYFNDKRDLFFYLLSLASQKKQEFLADILSNAANRTVFEQLDDLFTAMLHFQEQYPLYAQLGNRMLSDDSPLSNEILASARSATQKQFSQLFEGGKASGEVRFDADTEAAGFIVASLILSVGNQPLFDLDEFKGIYRNLLSILKNGLATPDTEQERKEK
jgi:AcrR family transcriptional regulator